MTQRLADYWSLLAGSVHPEDEAVFRTHADHGFNLNYPPPAFVGDVVHAPILVLGNNGGFHPTVTPREFPDEAARQEHRARLAHPRPAPRAGTAPYYQSLNFWSWLADGTAALVNGVAYRSVDGSAKKVASLTKVLPSARIHRSWLVEDILPSVKAGDRFVVFHRWTRWEEAKAAFEGVRGCVFSPAPVSEGLTKVEWSAAEAFLRGAGCRRA